MSMSTMNVYDAGNAVWVLEVKTIAETSWRRPEATRSARLERVLESARRYIGGDCSIRARHVLDGRVLDVRAMIS